MNFEYTEEQALLKDSVDRFVRERCEFSARSAQLKLAPYWSEAQWTQLAEIGLLGLPFESDVGGHGGGAEEIMIVCEALSRGLMVGPFHSAVLTAGKLIEVVGTQDQRMAWLPPLIQGAWRPALAYLESDQSFDARSRAVTAEKVPRGWFIQGEKRLVLQGDSADAFIVTAALADAANTQALFLVSADAPGVTREGYFLQDGQRAADVMFDGVPPEAVVRLGDGQTDTHTSLLKILDQALAAQCADAVGAMCEAHAITVDYLKTRKQFGVAIGTFQALQHRAVDMLVALEQARSMAIFAAMSCSETDTAKRSRAMSAAKLVVGRAARYIGQESIQLHGAIGMTEEYRVGHYFKRLTVFEAMFGSTDMHLARLSAHGSLDVDDRSGESLASQEAA